MKKYKIGLVILASLVGVVVIYVLAQGFIAKQDVQTDKKAKELATALNIYTTQQQKIPTALSDLSVKDIPKSVTYSKKSDSSYEFCVNYKAASSINEADATSLLTSVALAPLYGARFSSYNYPPSSDYSASSLYISPIHKKGKNCKTITPYFYNSTCKYGVNVSLCPSATSTPSSSYLYTTGLNDTERQTDIKALFAQIEAYFAQNGFYPTLANMNDSSWLAVNMKGLDKEALKDPKGTSYSLVTIPAKDVYSYDVKSADGKVCDNVTVDCTIYTLNAMLDDGQLYTKVALN